MQKSQRDQISPRQREWYGPQPGTPWEYAASKTRFGVAIPRLAEEFQQVGGLHVQIGLLRVAPIRSSVRRSAAVNRAGSRSRGRRAFCAPQAAATRTSTRRKSSSSTSLAAAGLWSSAASNRADCSRPRQSSPARMPATARRTASSSSATRDNSSSQSQTERRKPGCGSFNNLARAATRGASGTST